MSKLLYAPPKLLLVAGLPGSGKSTVANLVLEEVSATYLSKDTLADAFTKSRTSAFYTDVVSMPTYEALFNLSLDNLRLGNSVLIEAPARLRTMQNEEWRRLTLDRFISPVRTLLCSSSKDIIKGRLERRGEERDKNKLGGWDSFLETEWTEAWVPFSHIVVDTSKKIDIRKILAYLEGDG